MKSEAKKKGETFMLTANIAMMSGTSHCVYAITVKVVAFFDKQDQEKSTEQVKANRL